MMTNAPIVDAVGSKSSKYLGMRHRVGLVSLQSCHGPGLTEAWHWESLGAHSSHCTGTQAFEFGFLESG